MLIDLRKVVGRILVDLWYFSVRARNLLNLHKYLFLQWIYMFLTIRKTCSLTISWYLSILVLALIFDNLLALIWVPFGNLFGIAFHAFSRSYLFIICGWYFYEFNAISDLKIDTKACGTGLTACGLPPRFSCTLVSLTSVNLTSVIWTVFLISKSHSRFSCTLESIAHVKPKSVRWQEKRKFIVERLLILKAPRLRLGSIFVYVGTFLVSLSMLSRDHFFL